MLPRIPDDVAVDILLTWLPISLSCLSKLDVAHCNHAERRHWLYFLHAVSYSNVPTFSPLLVFLKWLLDRKVHTECIIADISMVHELDRVQFSISMPAILTVAFRAEGFSSSPFGLRAFFSLFPSIQVLSFVGCPVNDHQLLELCHFKLPIRKLFLKGCNLISAGTATNVINTMSSTLELLTCDVLDDWAVLTLSRSCRKIRSLELTVQSDKNKTSSILEFCAINMHLAVVSFVCVDRGPSPITNELVSSMVELCPHLQSVNLMNTTADYRSFITLVTNCAHLQAARVRNGKDSVEIKLCGQPAKICNLSWTGRSDLGHTLLSQLPQDIAVYSIYGGGAKARLLDKEGLLLLAQRHGPLLESVRLRLHTDVSKADVHLFLSRCPKLSTLMFKCADKDLLEDDDINCLSDYCPQLRSLGLLHCHKLTDAGIHRAICHLDKLMKLNVQGCAALTDLFTPAKSIELVR